MYPNDNRRYQKVPKTTPNATKSPPKVTKSASKVTTVSQNDAQEQKYRFLPDFDCILGAISAPLAIKIPIKYFKKGLRKSMQEKYTKIVMES